MLNCGGRAGRQAETGYSPFLNFGWLGGQLQRVDDPIEWNLGCFVQFLLELRANNYGARAFYRLLGFQEGAYIPGYYRGIETALRMSRDIRRHIPARMDR